MSWNYGGDNITITMSAMTRGWIGFGVSADGTMGTTGEISDIAVMWVDPADSAKCSTGCVYDYWIDVANSKTIPVYFFRFEDLMTDTERILKEIFEFSMGVESLKDTYLEKRIHDAVAQKNTSSTQFYKPRQGGINMNMHRFTDE